MSDVFISYRRVDSAGVVGRIYDTLVAAYGTGAVFKDVEDILAGRDFTDALRESLGRARVVLVVIGDRWLSVIGPDGQRRIEDPGDWVRAEVVMGLQKPQALVVPVLVNGARMPEAHELPPDLLPLRQRNAIEIRNDPYFHGDMARLLLQLEQQVPTLARRRLRRRSSLPLALGLLMLFMVLLLGTSYYADALGPVGQLPIIREIHLAWRGAPTLQPGAFVVVTQAGNALRMRTAPDEGFPVVAQFQVGDRLVLVSGPVEVEQIIWWRVRPSNRPNLIGWAAEGVVGSPSSERFFALVSASAPA